MDRLTDWSKTYILQVCCMGYNKDTFSLSSKNLYTNITTSRLHIQEIYYSTACEIFFKKQLKEDGIQFKTASFPLIFAAYSQQVHTVNHVLFVKLYFLIFNDKLAHNNKGQRHTRHFISPTWSNNKELFSNVAEVQVFVYIVYTINFMMHVNNIPYSVTTRGIATQLFMHKS